MGNVKVRYSVEVEYKPWPNDPIPWLWIVRDADYGTIIESGWAGTEDEAREFGADWRDRYVNGEWDED